MELADKGVRVNSVNPGVIITNVFSRSGLSNEQVESFYEHGKTIHALGNLWFDKWKMIWLVNIFYFMLGRNGEPNEVATVIAFLASNDSSFITGEHIHVDG